MDYYVFLDFDHLNNFNKFLNELENETNDIYNLWSTSSFHFSKPTQLENQNKKIKKRKETLIGELLTLNGIPFISDQAFLDSKTKRRPDFRIIIPGINELLIIIEVDEYQHVTYDQYEETKRMKQIYEDAKKDYILFIRYNPDNYRGIEVNGNLTKQTYKSGQQNRQDFLIYILNSLFQNKRESPLYQKILLNQKLGIHVLYLFYDGFIQNHLHEQNLESLELDYLNPFI